MLVQQQTGRIGENADPMRIPCTFSQVRPFRKASATSPMCAAADTGTLRA